MTSERGTQMETTEREFELLERTIRLVEDYTEALGITPSEFIDNAAAFYDEHHRNLIEIPGAEPRA
jgi:hypothetical protein